MKNSDTEVYSKFQLHSQSMGILIKGIHSLKKTRGTPITSHGIHNISKYNRNCMDLIYTPCCWPPVACIGLSSFSPCKALTNLLTLPGDLLAHKVLFHWLMGVTVWPLMGGVRWSVLPRPGCARWIHICASRCRSSHHPIWFILFIAVRHSWPLRTMAGAHFDALHAVKWFNSPRLQISREDGSRQLDSESNEFLHWKM